jgi:hypothetical protein
MNSNEQEPKGGTPQADASTFTDYWGDLLRASAPFWESQLDLWADALEQMRVGSYSATQYMRDVVRTWDAWAMLMATSLQFGRPQRNLPTLLFVVDGDAEFVGPVDAPTSVFLPPGVTTVVTDLYQIGGNATGGGQTVGPRSIDAIKHIRAQFSPARDRVEVTLVDLGRGQSERSNRGIASGLYVGAVYAMEVATRRPLAVVYVLIEESRVP